MIATAVTVGTTATLIVEPDNKNRVVYLHSGTGSIYIGGSDVTSSTGVHLTNGTTIEIALPLGESIYGITAASSQTMRVLTPDRD